MDPERITKLDFSSASEIIIDMHDLRNRNEQIKTNIFLYQMAQRVWSQESYSEKPT